MQIRVTLELIWIIFFNHYIFECQKWNILVIRYKLPMI